MQYGTFIHITAKKLNGSAFNLNGRIIADRATVNSVLNVARDFTLKSSSLKTISGFAGISAGTVYTPYILTREINFNENFGLTVSGELLVSSNSPIRFGSWYFPSTTPPSFASLTLSRAAIPAVPNADDFQGIITDGWQTK